MTGPAGPQVFEIDTDDLRSEQAASGIAAAAEVLASGGLVVFPTETVYGLGCRPDRADATDRVFAAKRRPWGLSLPVLAPDPESTWAIAAQTPLARALAGRLWPGAITLVLPRTDASTPWRLGEDQGSVAVRVPGHPLTSALLARSGPLATTSANRSGRRPLADPRDLVGTFGAAVAVFLVLSPLARPPGGLPSTVVDARGDHPVILRPGAVDEATVWAAATA